MNRLILLLLINIPLFAISQDTIQKSDYLRKGDFVYYNDHLFTGTAIKKAESGQIVAEEHFTNGLANGIWKEWYISGEKKFEGAFVNGKMKGFGFNGTKMEVCSGSLCLKTGNS
ncbi:MAG: hypothetical protein IPP51_04955 [Bacteroidetes bacterium]|nr:hypothetical protein [Bacteroidota bacterium]